MDTLVLAEAGLDWIESVGRRAAEETAGFAELLTTPEQEPARPEEPAWRVELEDTGNALLELTREVSGRIFPFELPRRESRQQNG